MSWRLVNASTMPSAAYARSTLWQPAGITSTLVNGGANASHVVVLVKCVSATTASAGYRKAQRPLACLVRGALRELE